MKASQRFVWGLIGWIGCIAAFAGPPHLVRDINSTIIPVHSDPGEFQDLGNWSFLLGGDELHRRNAWGTDGTPAGTLRLGLNNSLPSNGTGNPTAGAAGRAYFISTAEPVGYSLWSSDGTPQGTRLIADHNTLEGGDPSIGWPIGNDFLFVVRRSGWNFELWLTNGTAGGTHLVKVLNDALMAPDAFTIVNERLYFLAVRGDGTSEPWVTDGTSNGTQRLAQLPNATAQVGLVRIAHVGQYLVFAAPTSNRGNELWRIDLDTNAVTALPDIAPGAASGVNDLAIFGLAGNVAVFAASATGDNANPALWRTDGVTVSLLANVSPEQVNVDPYFGPTPGGRAFFVGTSAGNTRQLWSTDGVTATRLTSGDGSNGPGIAGRFGANLVFERSGAGGREAWVTDGTPAGTRQLAGLSGDLSSREFAGDSTALFIRDSNFTPNVPLGERVYRYDLATNAVTLIRSQVGEPSHLINSRLFAFARGKLYFNAEDPIVGNELWISDGTVAGTTLLKNLAPETRTQPSSPDNFVEFAGKLYFSADDGIHGKELWKSDGTSSGTELVKDLYDGPTSSEPVYSFVSNSKLYFYAKDGFNAYKFYVSDGSTSGTQQLAALFPPVILGGARCGAASVLLNGITFFSAHDPVAGLELWRTDGTVAGTVRVADINAGGGDAAPCWLTVYAGRVYFSANSGIENGTEVWSTDGSAAGTHMVADIWPGPYQSSWPRGFVVFKGALYFTATVPTGAQQLWKSDGTSAGTVPVSNFDFASYGALGDLSVVNGTLLFQVAGKQQGLTGSRLWSSDGSGTAVFGDINPLQTSLFSNNDRGYFVSRGVLNHFLDPEPWVTDGTFAGTHLLLDINSFAGSAPGGFTDFRGITLFHADDGSTGGVKLWRTDGTTGGTRLVGDIGQAPINPFTRLTAGQNFFYVSDVDGSGAELYVLSNDAPLAGSDAGGSVQAGASLVINVLANDSDADGSLDPASVRILTPPANGTAAVSADGVVTYTARAGFAGADSFTYTVDDNQGGRSFPATANVTVTAAPVTPPPLTPPTTPPATSDSGGGGGAFGTAELLFLLLLLMSVSRYGLTLPQQKQWTPPLR